jgi:hypothetical protein
MNVLIGLLLVFRNRHNVNDIIEASKNSVSTNQNKSLKTGSKL